MTRHRRTAQLSVQRLGLVLLAISVSACSSSGNPPSALDTPDAETRDGALPSSLDGAPADDAAVDDATASDAGGAGDSVDDPTVGDDEGANDGPADDMAGIDAGETDDTTDASDEGASDTRVDEPAASDAGGTNDTTAASDVAVADEPTPSDEGATDASADDKAASDAGVGDGDSQDARANDAPQASIVAPVLENADYVWASGDLSFAVDPQAGGRVVSFALSGQNVLTGTDANAINYGSTFWTSPQSDWNWPPPPEIDNQPYAASVDGGTLTLRGAANPALGVKITKVFSLDPASASVSIVYAIENVGASSRSLAPWEVSRVRPSGVMFFPSGGGAYSADTGPPLPTKQASGATWFDYGTSTITANIKYFANGLRGWLAQENGGVLFVKKFADVAIDAQAPGEAEIEMYVSGDRAYVELENQGSYSSIAAGTSLQWAVRWYLVRPPASVDASVGSASLVSFVDGLR